MDMQEFYKVNDTHILYLSLVQFQIKINILNNNPLFYMPT